MTEETILVTGGAGYIGSHTIVSLLETTPYRILSVDNYSNSNEKTYSRIKSITGKEVVFRKTDLSDRAATEQLFDEFPEITGVIHFAAYKSVPESVAQPLMYYRNNINSLLNVLDAGSRRAMKHVIFSSSCSVYGNIQTLPVDENTPPAPAESPYAQTKVIGEKILSDFIRASSCTGISLRYFNPVGAHESGLLGEVPGERPANLVPIITQTAIGKRPQTDVFGNDYDTRDGTCIRDYIHVCDIADAHVKALHHLISHPEAQAYDLFNLGSGEGVTVMEAIRSFEKVSGQKLNYRIAGRRAGDVEAIYSDSSKAKRILGWTARRSLDEMMASAWKWERHLAGKI